MSLHDCVLTRWSPGIGDPGLMGWMTVAAYVLAAALCFRRAVILDRRFWLPMGLLMVALAVNKQLDLQSALTAIARCNAQAQGWYKDRRSVQVVAISIFAVISLLSVPALGFLYRSIFHRIRLAIEGFCLLALFVSVRAVGFHHMDRFISFQVGPARMNWVLELGGIALIVIAAMLPVPPGVTGRAGQRAERARRIRPDREHRSGAR